MNFSSYNLNKELVNVLKELGYVTATPIQEAVLPKALKGKSLICKSETGSGKTHAFLIPSINNLDLNLDKIQVLIVSPTVELASQTYDFSKKICEKLNIGVRLLTSGITKQENLSSLAYDNIQPKIVIGTPGRVEDVLLKNNVDITGIKTLILDVCDMLLDEAYKGVILNLLDVIRPKQRLIFTATMKNHLISDTYKFVGAEEIIDINKKDKVNHNVSM